MVQIFKRNQLAHSKGRLVESPALGVVFSCLHEPQRYETTIQVSHHINIHSNLQKTMDSQKVDMFVTANAAFFNSRDLPLLRDRLSKVDASRWTFIQTAPLKNPTTALVLSLFAGTLGIDRFYIGNIGMGVGKLLTLGGFFIWALVDLFLIMSATKKRNLEIIQQFLY